MFDMGCGVILLGIGLRGSRRVHGLPVRGTWRLSAPLLLLGHGGLRVVVMVVNRGKRSLSNGGKPCSFRAKHA